MTDGTDKVTARLARMQARQGYAEREARHFDQWERQMGRRKAIWNAELFDREHERLMRDAVRAD